ncbi:MAG: hypothetical protein R3Y67_04245, partial [Eubacteriales bacterium]
TIEPTSKIESIQTIEPTSKIESIHTIEPTSKIESIRTIEAISKIESISTIEAASKIEPFSQIGLSNEVEVLRQVETSSSMEGLGPVHLEHLSQVEVPLEQQTQVQQTQAQQTKAQQTQAQQTQAQQTKVQQIQVQQTNQSLIQRQGDIEIPHAIREVINLTHVSLHETVLVKQSMFQEQMKARQDFYTREHSYVPVQAQLASENRQAIEIQVKQVTKLHEQGTRVDVHTLVGTTMKSIERLVQSSDYDIQERQLVQTKLQKVTFQYLTNEITRSEFQTQYMGQVNQYQDRLRVMHQVEASRDQREKIRHIREVEKVSSHSVQFMEAVPLLYESVRQLNSSEPVEQVSTHTTQTTSEQVATPQDITFHKTTTKKVTVEQDHMEEVIQKKAQEFSPKEKEYIIQTVEQSVDSSIAKLSKQVYRKLEDTLKKERSRRGL